MVDGDKKRKSEILAVGLKVNSDPIERMKAEDARETKENHDRLYSCCYERD
jgi:hypothetical protein